MSSFGRPHVGDVVAGVSVALVAIPQSLAYAELAGLPAQFGLYATALPSLAAALFVSSRYLQTGPVALTALLTFGALSSLAEPQTDDYIALAVLLALLVGVLRIALGVARLGRVAYLLSPPVVLGFTSAAVILITSSQLPKVVDVQPDEGGVVENAVHALTHPADWSWSAIAFSIGALIAIFGGRRLHPVFPGVLIAVLVGIAISTAVSYDGTIVGELEGGFISLGLDFQWSSTVDLLIPAVAIALVGFAEPTAIARTLAAADKEPWNANREMVSQGVANLASAASGAFPVGGSFSRSSLNKLAGARTAWAGAITGAFVLLALPLTPALRDLPQAILGAVVIAAVFRLLDVRGILTLHHKSATHAFVGIATLVATLATSPHIEYGVLIGVVLSVVLEKVTRQPLSEPPPVHEPVGN